MTNEERAQRLSEMLVECEASEQTKKLMEKTFKRMSFKNDSDFEDWIDETSANIALGNTKEPSKANRKEQDYKPPITPEEIDKDKELRPEFKNYLKRQIAKRRVTQYCTMAGAPQGAPANGASYGTMSVGKQQLNGILGGLHQ